MSEFHLNAGREGLVIMPSGLARQWALRESVKFTEEDMIFQAGQHELQTPRFKRLPRIQQARALQLNKHDYYTVFIREARHTGEVYLFAIHITELDSEDD
jgi:hypothetical protein